MYVEEVNSMDKTKKIFKDKNGKFRYTTLVWALLAVWAAYILISQQIKLRDQQGAIAEISENIEAEEQKNAELNETLETVGSDEYVEKIARQNLGYTMSNEQVFVDSSKSKK